MHGQQHIKICIAKPAKEIHRYKTIKTKLYKNNAAIWFNRPCRIKQLTPNYINPYPTAFPYGNGMVLHFYQQQESSTTKTVHKVINKGLKAYV